MASGWRGLASGIRAELRLRRSLRRRPGLTVRMDITNQCNLRCIMCHFADAEIRSRPYREFAPEEFRRFFDPIAPRTRVVVLSCGCEPLISSALAEILAYLRADHPHVEVELCTNGVLMDGGVRRLFLETGVATLMVSVDGVARETFEQIRRGASYDRVVGNLLALRDLKIESGASFPQVILIYVMMARNIHEAADFVAMARALGAAAVDFHHAVDGGRNFPGQERLALQPGRYNHYRARIAAAARETGLAVYLPPAFETNEATDPVAEPPPPSPDYLAVRPDRSGGETVRPAVFPEDFQPRDFRGTVMEEFSGAACVRPFSEIVIREQNEVLPCAWLGEPVGKLETGATLWSVFFGPRFRRLRRTMIEGRVGPECAACPVRAAELPTAAEKEPHSRGQD